MLFGRFVPVDTIVARNRADGDDRLKHPGGGINNWTGDYDGGTNRDPAQWLIGDRQHP